MLFRFILYGLLGIAIEVIWTALYEKLFEHKPGWDLKGTTYVWMMPVYGLTVVLYEPVYHAIDELGWMWRGLIYAIGILVVEYVVGFVLRKIDRCPWDYTDATRFQIHGLIRLDYAPLWFALGLALEPISDLLIRITPLVYSVF